MSADTTINDHRGEEVYWIYTAFLRILTIFSIAILVVSTGMAMLLGIPAPATRPLLIYLVSAALSGFGLCFYAASLDNNLRNPHKWRIIAIFAPVSIIPFTATLHSIKHAIPSSLSPTWPTVMPLTAFAGLMAAAFLSIHWAIIDERRDYSGAKAPSIFDAPEKDQGKVARHYVPFRRLTVAAVLAGVSLIGINVIMTPHASMVHSHLASLQATQDSSETPLPQSGQPSSLNVAWNVSTHSTNLLSGTHGPIVVRDGKISIVQGLSNKDGAELWHWKLNPNAALAISTRSSTVSPDGRYLAIVVYPTQFRAHSLEPDIPSHLVVLDTDRGKELWSMTLNGFHDEFIHLILTNRAAVIGHQVYDLTNGAHLWNLPEGEYAAPYIGAKETIVSVKKVETSDFDQSAFYSCSCSHDIFTPLDDLTGQPTGEAFTHAVSTYDNIYAASKGWILIHDKGTLTNSLHNIDTGEVIAAPSGKPDYPALDLNIGLEGVDPLRLSFSPPFSAPKGVKARQSYIFDPHTAFLTPIGKEPHNFNDLGVYYFPYGKNAIAQVSLFSGRPEPTLRLLNPATEEILMDITIPNDIQNREHEKRLGIERLVRTKEGWVAQVGGGSYLMYHGYPTQIVMIK